MLTKVMYPIVKASFSALKLCGNKNLDRVDFGQDEDNMYFTESSVLSKESCTLSGPKFRYYCSLHIKRI